MEKCITLCSAHCIHNDGHGYYNICNHIINKDKPCYGGIDRIYVEGCCMKEKPK